MKTRSRIVAVIAISILLALKCSIRQPGINVLLISLDTLRPDHLGCYGYERIKTPNIDAIGQEGILFADAISSVPLTLPSHATILTGLSILSHGVRDNGTFVLRDEFTTLAEIFKENGYSTAAFIGAFVLDGRYGLNQGFEIYDDNLGVEENFWSFDYPQRKGEAVTDATLRWLADVKQPFFAFVHYYDPHTPYDPPAPYDSIYADNPYDGEVAYTDHQVGRLLQRLSETGLRKNTLVVIVSDHGEGLGDHGESVHGTLLYESTLRVAFIVSLPDKHPLKKKVSGTRIDQTVALIDVAPTLIDLCGIKFRGKFDGVSLVPVLQGKNMASRFIYFETLYPYFAYKWSPLRGIRFNKWKLIYSTKPELYNLADDPHELTNLYEANRHIADDLKANLELMVKQSQSTAQAQKPLSIEEERRLRALGYISKTQSSIPVDIEPAGPNPKDMIGYAETYLANGMIAFTHRKLDEALENFSKMVEVDPTNIEARMLLGRTLLEMGRFEEASRQFLQATQIDSTYAEGFFRLGIMCREEGDLDKAFVFFSLAAKLQPQLPGAIANAGAVLLEKGMIDSSRALLRDALAIDAKDQVAITNMALSYLQEDKLDTALIWFHRLIGINPTKVKALVSIGDIYLKLGKPDSTIVYLEKARVIEPSNLAILRNLGNVYRAVGKNEQAGSIFEEALSIEPNDYISLFGLAATKAAQNEIGKSIELLRKVIQIKPDFEPAKVALNRLIEMESQSSKVNQH